MKELNPAYWTQRYQENQTGWDLGQVSPPLKAYFDQLENKNLRILIPGCGRGYEGIYLLEKGFQNVFLADYSEAALGEIKRTCPHYPQNQLHCVNFFDLEGHYDLIIEQTMFCAIDPSLRLAYVQKAADLLAENGKIVGVLFNRDFEGGPPFGGSKEEYWTHFEKHFDIITMEECHNSIQPRLGHEVFFIAKKK